MWEKVVGQLMASYHVYPKTSQDVDNLTSAEITMYANQHILHNQIISHN
jgi:hypothetical protein